MTAEEYNEKLNIILAELPFEFQIMVRSYAWDKGHAYGYEEVLGHAGNLVDELVGPIANFRIRVVAEARKQS